MKLSKADVSGERVEGFIYDVTMEISAPPALADNTYNRNGELVN